VFTFAMLMAGDRGKSGASAFRLVEGGGLRGYMADSDFLVQQGPSGEYAAAIKAFIVKRVGISDFCLHFENLMLIGFSIGHWRRSSAAGAGGLDRQDHRLLGWHATR